jgi:hypothetical protein
MIVTHPHKILNMTYIFSIYLSWCVLLSLDIKNPVKDVNIPNIPTTNAPDQLILAMLVSFEMVLGLRILYVAHNTDKHNIIKIIVMPILINRTYLLNVVSSFLMTLITLSDGIILTDELEKSTVKIISNKIDNPVNNHIL